MKYGCIGEHLSHSFSAVIHNLIADYPYDICEVAKEDLDSFMKKREFNALNVTIPYKEAVIPYLDCYDEKARLIGAVNTVVNKDGKLCGYNTDFYGMEKLLEHSGICVSGKKALILGSGGTSKTAYAVLTHLCAREILKVSRTKKEGTLTYDEIYEKHLDAEIIINTTPVGMFPNIIGMPIDISRFPKLCGIIDAVYNPIKTDFVLAAEKTGIAAEGGLYMLVAQAVRASEIFFDKTYGKDLTEKIYKKILCDKQNIVLVGMPSCGKSTVGKLLANKLSRQFYDTDELVVKNTGTEISDIFKNRGEEYFRTLESEVIGEISSIGGAVIASGGGAVLREGNVDALKKNGKIYFLDRSLNLLIPTGDRPLSNDVTSLEKRYKERYEIYKNAADTVIPADGTPEEVCDLILKDFIL